MNPETQGKSKVEVREISYDGIMSWKDVWLVSGKPSRKTVWLWEKEGKFPKRVQVSPGRVGWKGLEIKARNESLPRVNPGSCEMESEVVSI